MLCRVTSAAIPDVSKGRAFETSGLITPSVNIPEDWNLQQNRYENSDVMF